VLKPDLYSFDSQREVMTNSFSATIYHITYWTFVEQ